MHQFSVGDIIILVVVVVAMIIDWRTTKIPNLITFPAAAVGIIYNGVTAGWPGALYAVLGWIVGAAVTLFFSWLPLGGKGEKLGMGDAKLMAAVGAFLGWQGVLITFFYFCLSFGLISIIVLARAVPWDKVWAALMTSLSGAKTVPKIESEHLTRVKRKPIPAGFAIGFGALFTILFKEETLKFMGF